MKSAESFHVLTQAYFKSVHVFALVFSVQQRASFDNVQRWLDNKIIFSFRSASFFILLFVFVFLLDECVFSIELLHLNNFTWSDTL